MLIQADYERPASRKAIEAAKREGGAPPGPTRMLNVVELATGQAGRYSFRSMLTVRANGLPQDLSGKRARVALVDVRDSDWGVLYDVELLEIEGKPVSPR